MSLIDKLEDLVVKVDTEYQEKMEAVIGAHDTALTGEGRQWSFKVGRSRSD